jgi:hypothetical protein
MEPRAEAPVRPSPPLPASDWALFLDVDGCLLDFAPHPTEVVVPPGLQADIASLALQLDGALAVVSGIRLAGPLDAPEAMDGELAVTAPWKIAEEGLTPLSFRYGVSKTTPDSSA